MNDNNMNNMNEDDMKKLLDARLAAFTASLPTSMPSGFMGPGTLLKLMLDYDIDERLRAHVSQLFRFKAEEGGSAMAHAEAVGAIIRHSVPDVGPLDTPERIAGAHARLAFIREGRKWAWIEAQTALSEEDREILAETAIHMANDLGYRITFEYPSKDDPDLRLIIRNLCRERETLACLQRFLSDFTLGETLGELDEIARERILPLVKGDEDLAESIGQDLSGHIVAIPDDRFAEWWRPYW